MKKIIGIFILSLMLLPLNTLAQEDYTVHPGYVDFGDLKPFETGDKETEVLIEEKLLKMVSKLTQKQDPELEELLSGLKLVKVNAFEYDKKDKNKILQRINEVDDNLMKSNWDRIVKIRGTEENTNVYIKSNGDLIDGLVVTTLEPNGEAVFVNIVGTIDLAVIGKLGNKFDIPSLDKVKNSEKDGGK